MPAGDLLTTWIAAFLTLAILSFLYRDNPVFRLAENIFTGVSLGYYVGQVAAQTLKANLVRPLADDFAAHWHLLFAGALGVLLYARYVGRISWLGRWALAVYVGYYVGITMMQKLQGEVIPQTRDTLAPLRSLDATTFNRGLVAVGVLAVLTYFFFSREQRGAVAGVSRVGILFLMVSFGAAFGYTVMARVSVLIGRMSFLVSDWVGGTISALRGG